MATPPHADPDGRIRSRTWGLVPALVGVAALAATWALLRSRPEPHHESVAQAAARIRACFEARDGACLSEYVSKDEATRTGLDAEKLQALLSGLVREQLSGFDPAGPVNALREDASVSFTDRLYVHSDGRRVSVGFEVYATEEGPKAFPLLTQIVIACSSTLRKPEEGQAPSALWTAWARGARQFEPRLTKLGLSGMVVNGRKGDVFYRWSEWHKETAVRSAKTRS